MKNNKGIFPAVKSWLFGDDVAHDEQQTYVNASNDPDFWKLVISTHTFNRQALRKLVELGYTNSPGGFGIINKILLAQKNIIFTPYWGGKPYKSKKYEIDTNYGLMMLLLTGTCVIYPKEVVGFSPKLEVLKTLDIEETFVAGKFAYRYYMDNGSWINLDPEQMIIIKIFDVGKKNTQMGLPPFQAALMPLESLKEMYVADTSTLKNKGSDVLITNDSDTPIIEDEKDGMDKAINRRIKGSRRAGGVATSTGKLRVLELGRTTKELALWDGYKIKTRDLCNVLQVDSGQLNDPDNKKFANVGESNKALYNDCVIPFTKLITENPKLKQVLGYDIFLDVSQIDCLQQSQATRAEKANTVTQAIVGLNKDVQSGSITPEIAVKILVSEWSFDEEEAKGYIKSPDKPKDATENPPPAA
jgi:hypothetical protein